MLSGNSGAFVFTCNPGSLCATAATSGVVWTGTCHDLIYDSEHPTYITPGVSQRLFAHPIMIIAVSFASSVVARLKPDFILLDVSTLVNSLTHYIYTQPNTPNNIVNSFISTDFNININSNNKH